MLQLNRNKKTLLIKPIKAYYKGQNAYDENGNVMLKDIKYISDNKWSCYFGHSEDNWW